MNEGLDSARGSIGQAYGAAVNQDANLGGLAVPKGSPAVVVLAKGVPGFDFTMVLARLVVNGQSYALTGHNPVARASAAGIVGGILRKGPAQNPVVATPHRIAVPAGEILTFTVDATPALEAATPAQPNPAPPVPQVRPASPPAQLPQATPAPGTPAIPTRGNLAPEPGTRVGDPSAVLEEHGFRVQLLGCSKDGGSSAPATSSSRTSARTAGAFP